MQKLLKIFNTVLSNNELSEIDKLIPSNHLQNDLGMDSINLAELTVRIEDEYDVDVFEKEIVRTVGEIIKILDQEGKIK